MITVALADDHELVRTGFKLILREDPEIAIVGEASDGASATLLAIKEQPDILLLDLSMPPFQSGLTALSDITAKCPHTRVIVFTMHSDVDYLRHTFSHGARGYVVKTASAEDLLRAVHIVAAGERYIHPSMLKLLGDEEFDADISVDQLTARELVILRLLAMGFTNREISDKLYLSVKTIESHRAKLYAKLGIKTRAELVRYALKRNLLNDASGEIE